MSPDQRTGEALSRDGARCNRCGHYETDYDRAESLYAHCPSCSRHTRWERVPCSSDAWVPGVGDRVLIGGTSLVELRGLAGVVRDVRGGEALVEMTLPDGLGAMHWLFFEQLIPDRSSPGPRTNEASQHWALAPERVELWDAIHAYARASYTGEERGPSGARMDAVVRVENAVTAVVAMRQRTEPAPPECDYVGRCNSNRCPKHGQRRERARYQAAVTAVDLDADDAPLVTVRFHAPEDEARRLFGANVVVEVKS